VLPATARSKTAQNYSSALIAYGKWSQKVGEALPTRNVLMRWRTEMENDETGGRNGPVSVSTINTRLSAMRKLLMTASDIILDMQTKDLLRDWAKIADAKKVYNQDRSEEDFGRHLTIDQVNNLFDVIGTDSIRAMRDRAVVALGIGAGLRISEITSLTVKDVFFTKLGENHGIRINNGKHKKSRIAVVGDKDSWVLRYVREYCDVIGVNTSAASKERIIRGVRKANAPKYTSRGKSLCVRSAQKLLEKYIIDIDGVMSAINAHDMRRTYARLSKDAGMTWEALSAQLGHSSIAQTERYVGRVGNSNDRVLTWGVR